MRKCLLSSLDRLFEAISQTMPLYIPTDDGEGNSAYKEWQKGSKLSKSLNTVKSPKDFFFPQVENLMEFKVSGKEIELIDIRDEKEDFVIFGVRPCDVKSFDILDNVFLKDPVDSYYKQRREHGIIISLACSKPSETCFCQTFDIDPTSPEGDIAAWKTDEELYLQSNTEKGELLLKQVESLTEEADGAEVEEQRKETQKILKKLPFASLKTDSFGKGKTKELFDSPQWEELSKTCLGCGTCTFVCPTCQCYDIKDFNNGKGILRFRCWDSCMYSEFTQMSAGQPRLTQKERFRQRFMHKLVYYPENNDGLFSCVGCGRCVAKCPISMNIAKVMKTLGGKDHE